jgi:hypothetical protein
MSKSAETYGRPGLISKGSFTVCTLGNLGHGSFESTAVLKADDSEEIGTTGGGADSTK